MIICFSLSHFLKLLFWYFFQYWPVAKFTYLAIAIIFIMVRIKKSLKKEEFKKKEEEMRIQKEEERKKKEEQIRLQKKEEEERVERIAKIFAKALKEEGIDTDKITSTEERIRKSYFEDSSEK